MRRQGDLAAGLRAFGQYVAAAFETDNELAAGDDLVEQRLFFVAHEITVDGKPVNCCDVTMAGW